jgi:hypothetical protein
MIRHVVVYQNSSGELDRAIATTAVRNALVEAKRLVRDSGELKDFPKEELLVLLGELQEIRASQVDRRAGSTDRF